MLGRVPSVSKGTKDNVATYWNALRTDYFSQTATEAQTVASDVTFNGDVTLNGSATLNNLACGEATVANGGTIAHGLTGTPKATVTPKAAQPYAASCITDATNITVYHNKVGNLTVFWIAMV